MTRLDALYIPLALVTAPWWAFKKRSGYREKLGRVVPLPPKQPGRPRVLLHAVSVGEVSALRSLVPLLTPHVDVVVSVSTDTGIKRAKDLFGSIATVVRYPLDFSFAVRKFLDAVQPDAIALVELELWPQFLRQCAARSIPACVINGRLSERSARGYARIARTFTHMLDLLQFAAVQDQTYAHRFQQLGLRQDRGLLTGSMKWDAASLTSSPAAQASLEASAAMLAREMGIDRTKPVIVAGSTAEDEESLLVRALATLPGDVQLVCAPRKPEHFDAAAKAMPGCVRRSEKRAGDPGQRLFLLDTIGELRAAFALADVVVMGRSFGTLYGSDPIEPIALGKATVIGPRFGDFDSIVRTLKAGGGLVVCERDGLAAELSRLLASRPTRSSLANKGLACIRQAQGASERHAELLLSLVGVSTPLDLPRRLVSEREVLKLVEIGSGRRAGTRIGGSADGLGGKA